MTPGGPHGGDPGENFAATVKYGCFFVIAIIIAAGLADILASLFSYYWNTP